MDEPNIINTDRPNAGRIYDYLLGGNHNFEIDRQAAKAIVQTMPFVSKAMRLQRWCLQDLAEDLTQNRKFDTIIDFASGLPTNDHFHQVVPSGTTIIYSDQDPIVVQYAKNILGDIPNVYYFRADIRHPEALLNRPDVQNILAGRRDVALVSWGISLFLADEDIAHLAQYLYEWAGPESCWAFNVQGAVEDPDAPEVNQVRAIYERTGTPIYIRTLDRFIELLSPWKTDKKGFISLLEWQGLDEDILNEEDRQVLGATSGLYGAYLFK